MENCVFCKIKNGEIPSDKLYEDDFFFIIKDINPEAKLHYLAIPKSHYARLEGADDNMEAVRRIFQTLPTLKQKLGLEGGYRIIINQGENAHQAVGHLHIHILGGEDLGTKIIA